MTHSPAASLRIEPNIADADSFYEALLELHRDLDEGQSALVNAKLVLLLANHVGDGEVLAEAMRLAREGAGPGAPAGSGAPVQAPKHSAG